MSTKSITFRLLASIKKPKSTIVYYDTKLKGFMCRIYTSGRISYFSIFKTRDSANQIYRHIGTFPALHPQEARQLCKSDQIQIALGHNPLDKFKPRSKNDNDFCHYIDRFIDEHVSTKKKETIIFYNKIIKLHILPHFKNISVSEIRQSDILLLKKKMASIKTTYNRTHAVLNKYFNFCIMHEVIQNNPMKGISKYKENKRTGRISPEEYKLIISSINALLNMNSITNVAASALLFLIFSGCRVSECLSCEWQYVDIKEGVINIPDSKTGAKIVFIGENLHKLLQSLPHKNSYVFPAKYGKNHLVNIYKLFKAVLEKAGLAGKYVIHEIRHGFISAGINNNISTAAVQAAVSHKSILTTQGYSHLSEDTARTTSCAIENIITQDSMLDINKIIQSMR